MNLRRTLDRAKSDTPRIDACLNQTASDGVVIRGLAFVGRELERELAASQKESAERHAEIKRLRLLLTGVMDQNVSIKVTLDPAIFNQASFDAVQHLQRHHAKYTAHQIEQLLGGPLRRLQEALMHIHYLENHARNRGLQFSEWAVTERDKELWY